MAGDPAGPEWSKNGQFRSVPFNMAEGSGKRLSGGWRIRGVRKTAEGIGSRVMAPHRAVEDSTALLGDPGMRPSLKVEAAIRDVGRARAAAALPRQSSQAGGSSHTLGCAHWASSGLIGAHWASSGLIGAHRGSSNLTGALIGPHWGPHWVQCHPGQLTSFSSSGDCSCRTRVTRGCAGATASTRGRASSF